MKRPNMLVPTDFSEFSLKAFEAAASLSHLVGGTITPFHAYLPVSEMDSFYYSGVGLSGHIDYDKVETSIKERLHETASKLVAGKALKTGRPMAEPVSHGYCSVPFPKKCFGCRTRRF